MKSSPGWILLEEELFLRLHSYGQRILMAEKIAEIHRLQGQMNEINSILSFVKTKVDDIDSAKKQLKRD